MALRAVPCYSFAGMNVWLKTAVALAALWMVAAGAIHWLHASQPTAASVTDYLAHTRLDTLSGRDRERTIRRVEDQLNDVSFEERQRLQRNGVTRQFYRALTPAEQAAFLDATLPADFRQMMEAFNQMEPAKRKAFVEHAVNEMKQHEGEGPPPGMDEQMNQRVIDQGMKSFYSDASADTKLDLAPLIEQMQRNLQAGGSR